MRKTDWKEKVEEDGRNYYNFLGLQKKQPAGSMKYRSQEETSIITQIFSYLIYKTFIISLQNTKEIIF